MRPALLVMACSAAKVAQAGLLILLSAALIVGSLWLLVRVLRSALRSRVEVYVSRALGQAAVVSMIIGAVVTVSAGEATLMRQVEGGKGTGVQNSLALHFGLGEATSADEVVVRWPSGTVDTYTDVAADQRVFWWEGGEVPGGDAGPDAGPDADADGAPIPFRVRGGCGGCSAAGSSAGWEGLLGLLTLVLFLGRKR